MTTIVKVHRKGQMTLPTKLRSLAGIDEGDLLQATFERGRIVITPALVIDRSKFPTADDEYTTRQRRIIDADLAKGLTDVKAGRVSKAFTSAEDFVADLHRAIKKPTSRSKTKRQAK
jgi:AbrB family looped-hinge helix DNA binding protein